MSKGDKYCIICREWLGNYLTGETPTGQASYYSIINRKYCPTCKPWKRSLDVRYNQAEYRKRKRQLHKATQQRMAALTDENKALRKIIMQLRDELGH